MTVIRLDINQTDPAKNLARATLAMQSIASPSAGAPAIPGATPKAPPIRAAINPSPGIRGWYDAFWIRPNPADATKTDIHAQLPYAPKVYDQTLDLRESIQTVSALITTVKGVTNPVAITGTVPNLETYLFDNAVKAGATIVQMTDPVSGRNFLDIKLTTGQSIDALLEDTTASVVNTAN